MDPLSALASLLAVATVGVQSTRSLKDATKRYKTRDATLRKLLEQVDDVENILRALEEVLQAVTSQPALDADISMVSLLRSPIERCSKVCGEFEDAMGRFSSKAKTSFLDWTKMEFMRGDVNQFMDNLAGYKATISVGLGVLTMRMARLSHQALGEYDDLVKNTMYDLNVRLQRIDDKMDGLAPPNDPGASPMDIDLKDEQQVTRQCLEICEDAKLYLDSLANRNSTLLQEASAGDAKNAVQERFEAQLLTRQAIGDNHASLVKIITRLRERLESVVMDGDSSERSRLQEDIQTSKQCLEVCKLASSEVVNQKIHLVGEAIADGDSDHVVVTTLADMFSVGKAISKNRSALLVGSMSDAALIKLSHDRYNSSFGTANTTVRVAQGGAGVSDPQASSQGSQFEDSRDKNKRSYQSSPPSSNETRKRVADP